MSREGFTKQKILELGFVGYVGVYQTDLGGGNSTYKFSLRSFKHLKLSVALHLVPYLWNINIRARNEAGGACGVK